MIKTGGSFSFTEFRKLFDRQSFYHQQKEFSCVCLMSCHLLNGRIADALLFLSDEIFKSGKFKMILNPQELADLTGTSKESVSRILNLLHDEKLIEMDGKMLMIRNKKELENISKHG